MRSSDIVNQLATVLPSLVDDFTDQVPVSSIVQSSGVATATTNSPHGLIAGRQIIITGAQTPIEILSISRLCSIATMITQTDHDITENAGFNVQINGSDQSEFNGSFVLLKVPNRRTLKFTVSDSGPTNSTGPALLLNGSSPFNNYNGLVQITSTPSENTFQYLVPSNLYSPAEGAIIAKSNPRISASVDFERLLEAYTKQGQDKAWLFVVLGDSIADKSRKIETDSTDNIQSGNYFNQRLVQSFSLYLFLPTNEQIAARQARDRCEELLKPICNSILTYKFPSLVENNNNPLMITGHGFQTYNSAFYVHQYAFECTLQMGPTDVFIPDIDVAFRDISIDMGISHGSENLIASINLDEEPL